MKKFKIALSMLAITAASLFAVSKSNIGLGETISREMTENPVISNVHHERAQVVKASTKVDNSQTVTYILYGKSMFDENDENVYRYGGYPVEYPVYVNINEDENTAAIENLINVIGYDSQPANGSYDPETHQITIVAPIKNSQAGKCQVIGHYGEQSIILRAGNPYGAGYLDKVENVTLQCSEDFSKIVPQSGLTANLAEWVEDDDETYMDVYGYFDVVYDAVLLKKVDGVSFATNIDIMNFNDTYVNKEYTQTFLLYNIGSESSDYIISTDDDAFTVEENSGELESEGFKEITVKFTPTTAKHYQSTLSIISGSSEISRDTVIVKCK